MDSAEETVLMRIIDIPSKFASFEKCESGVCSTKRVRVRNILPLLPAANGVKSPKEEGSAETTPTGERAKAAHLLSVFPYTLDTKW